LKIYLCAPHNVLGAAFAVDLNVKEVHRRVAENAEEAQRVEIRTPPDIELTRMVTNCRSSGDTLTLVA
jgi:hypothetical protein